jgi:ADP-heptose:LPS heptosyltransferase
VLVGPGDNSRYRPHLDPDQMVMLKNAVPCSPCYYQDCPLPANENKKCMTGISPDSVVQAFAKVFGN